MNHDILEQQRQTWNLYSGGWKKWDKLLMASMQKVSSAMINTLNLKGDEHVLDVASGTGEPGLSLSKKLPQGKVTGCDLAEEMVKVANEHAQSRGITNYQSVACDAADMPFESNSFDHVISRFGIMFFPDMEDGVKEMYRVLKPEGKLCIAVWAAPEKNPFITMMAKTVMEKLGVSPPPPDAPGIFRCAQPGLAGQLLKQSGFTNVSEHTLTGEGEYDSPQQYWEVMTDVAGPIMELLKEAPPETVEDIKNTVMKKAEGFVMEGKIRTPWEAIMVTGVKD